MMDETLLNTLYQSAFTSQVKKSLWKVFGRRATTHQKHGRGSFLVIIQFSHLWGFSLAGMAEGPDSDGPPGRVRIKTPKMGTE